jgi:hypothetical protein
MLRRSLFALFVSMPALFLACGGDDGGASKTPAAADFKPSSDPASNVPPDQRGKINVVMAGDELTVGKNNFVFGVTDKKDEPQGGAKAFATFYDLKDPRSPKLVFQAEAVQSAPGVGKVVEHTHANGEAHKHGGEDDNRVGYYLQVTFDHAGPWGVAVEAQLKDGTKGISSIGFQVMEKPRIPAPGQQAIRSDNLTKKDVKDIREIDSGIPPNDMHDVKIKDAIANGRPLVVVFSTPSFCISRFCGPVNEEVESLQDTYKDRVDFVHIEIWRNFEKKELNPTAKEWLLRADGGLSEPFVYVVDKKGTIYDRFEGPSARNIMEASVKAVAEGKTYGSP